MGKSSTEIGDKFFLGMHHIICESPIDEIQEITMGKKTIYDQVINTNTEITIDRPEIFGGEKKEGGVVGNIDIMLGDENQLQNQYLMDKISPIMPAFRGVVSVIWKQCYLSALTPYIKATFYKVKSIKGKEWYPEKADINGSNNPAHIAYDVIVNVMGEDSNKINDESFRNAADIFHSENFGLSLTLNNGDAQKFLEEIQRHSHSIIDQDPTDGKYYITLFRDSIDSSNLIVFDNTNIDSFQSFSRSSRSDLVNKIIVKYRPQGKDFDESVSFDNLASIQLQGAEIAQTINYPAIDAENNAVAAASRDLAAISTPLAKISITATREANRLNRGDLIKVTWPKFSLVEVVFRVLTVDYGTLRDRKISFTAIEDVFSIPKSQYVSVQQTLFVDPIQPPTEAINKKLIELNYFDLVFTNNIDVDDFDSSSAFLGGLMGEEEKYIPDWELWRESNAVYEKGAESQASIFAKLNADISKDQEIVTIKENSKSFDSYEIGDLVLINDEIMYLFSKASDSEITLKRGCLDTTPQEHSENDIIWFYNNSIAAINEEFLDGQQINTKTLMRSGSELFDIDAAIVQNKTLTGRFFKPYLPGNIRLNDLYYPALLTGGLNIKWSHRDKTQQLVSPPHDFKFGNIGPEKNSSYHIKLTRVSNSDVLLEEFGRKITEYNYLNDSIYYISSSLPNGYGSGRIFFMGVTTGTTNDGGGDVAYYISSYDSTAIGDSSYSTNFQNTIDVGSFEYENSRFGTPAAKGSDRTVPIYLFKHGLNFIFNFNENSKMEIRIEFLNENDDSVFSFKMEYDGNNYYFGIGENKTEARNNLEIIDNMQNFSLTANENQVSFGALLKTFECNAIEITKMKVNEFSLSLGSSVTELRSSFFEVRASMLSSVSGTYPASLPLNEDLKFEIESQIKDSKSYQKFEHAFQIGS